VETLNPSEVFPEIAVCPGFDSNGTLGQISSVTCSFQSYGNTNQPVDVLGPTSYTIEGVNHQCYRLNSKLAFVSRNLTDLIRCTVSSNVNVMSHYYDENTGYSTYWFAWTVLPYSHDTAVGLVKWFFNGEEVGYKVQTVQEEYRFGGNNMRSGVQFTVQWDFLGQGRYGEIFTHDFWTSVGVIGGYVFLIVQFFNFSVWIGNNCLRLQEDNEYRQPAPEPSNYQSL